MARTERATLRMHPRIISLPRVREGWCDADLGGGVSSGKGGVEVLQHTHDVLALAWAPSGKMLASATLDGQIHLWDPLEAELLVSGMTFLPGLGTMLAHILGQHARSQSAELHLVVLCFLSTSIAR